MRLMINTATVYKGGSVQVANSFINECKNHPDHNFAVVLSLSVAELINPDEFPDNFIFYRIPYRPASKVMSFEKQSAYLEEVENSFSPNVVFTTSGPAYWRPKAPHLMGFNLAHYLYFKSPYFTLLSPFEKFKWWLKGKFIRHYFLRDADSYVTQTDDINAKFRKWTGVDKVYTVSNTYGSQYNQIGANSKLILSSRKQHEVRFIVLSAYYRHKNLEIIGEVVRLLVLKGIDKVRFVLTLPEDKYKELYSAELRTFILNVGQVRPQTCPVLYEECDYAFIPTLLECFSAAYPEAMVMGKPIVTTDLDFAHSICDNAALYYDALSAESACEAIERLINSPELQKRLRSNGYQRLQVFDSARSRAEKYLKICQDMVL